MWIVNVNLGVSCYLSAEAFLKGRSAPKRPSSEPPQRIGIGQLLPAMELDLFWLPIVPRGQTFLDGARGNIQILTVLGDIICLLFIRRHKTSD